jgi:uncharacterized protein YcbK (DUF882 family)
MKVISRNRRSFLQSCLGAGLGLAAMRILASGVQMPARELALYNTHTGESLSCAYWADGQYLEDSLTEISHIRRDHRAGEVHPIAPGLLDLLSSLYNEVSGNRPFEIISGYRSPATNAKLRNKSSGVAKRSLHMSGKAIDVRLPGCELDNLRQAALAMKAGGVGYYPSSNFIHVDVGRVRYW